MLGIDRERAVITEAGRLSPANRPDNIRFITGDVYSLELDDQSFDVVHAHQVLRGRLFGGPAGGFDQCGQRQPTSKLRGLRLRLKQSALNRLLVPVELDHDSNRHGMRIAGRDRVRIGEDPLS